MAERVYFKIEGAKEEKERINFPILLSMGVSTKQVDDSLLICPAKAENQAEAIQHLRKNGFKCKYQRAELFIKGHRIIYTVTIPNMNPPWYDRRR